MDRKERTRAHGDKSILHYFILILFLTLLFPKENPFPLSFSFSFLNLQSEHVLGYGELEDSI